MDLPQAITHCRPGASWQLHGDDYANLAWFDTTQAKPTLAELEAAWAELSAPKPPPPVVVTMRSFRLAMGRDLFLKTAATVAKLDDAEKKYQATVFLEYSPTVNRAQFEDILGLPSATLDAVFAKAKQLDAAQ